MLHLRLMKDAEYADFLPREREEYARVRARNSHLSLENDREIANQEIDELLPKGPRTPGHFIWRITTEDGQHIGVLRVLENAHEHTAFINQFALDETQRNQGYGTEVLRLLEQESRPHGVR